MGVGFMLLMQLSPSTLKWIAVIGLSIFAVLTYLSAPQQAGDGTDG